MEGTVENQTPKLLALQPDTLTHHSLPLQENQMGCCPVLVNMIVTSNVALILAYGGESEWIDFRFILPWQQKFSTFKS